MAQMEVFGRQVKIKLIPGMIAFVAVCLCVIAGLYLSSQISKNPSTILIAPEEDIAQANALKLYNSGVVQYKNENQDEATKLWKLALTKDEVPVRIKFYLFFNLGIVHYRLATDSVEQNKLEEAIKSAEQSVAYFRDSNSYVSDAVKADESLTVLQKNLELAKRLLVTLLEKQKAIKDAEQEETPLEIIERLIKQEADIARRLSAVQGMKDEDEKLESMRILTALREETAAALNKLLQGPAPRP